MPLQPGFLYSLLAYESDKTGYLAGWTLSKSFAPPLRIRRDGSTLESVHTKHQFLPLIGRSSGLQDQNRQEATSHQKLATDGASPELTPTHTECLKYSHHELAQLTTQARSTGGGGGLAVIRNRPKANRFRLAIWMITLVRPTEPLIQPVFEHKVQNSAGIRDCCELLCYRYVKL